MKNKKNILLIINIVLITGFLLTSIISYIISINSIREQILKKQLPITSDNVYSEVQRDLLKPITISSLMASDTFLRDWVINGEKDELKIRKYLNEVQEKYSVFTSFFVSEKTNIYYHSTGILKKVDENNSRDEWYYRVKKIKENYEINVDIDMANNDYLTIFINYKVFDYKGKFIGVTGVGLKVDTMKAFIENYQKKYHSTIYFVDKDGNIKLSNSKFNKNITNIHDIHGMKHITKDILSNNSKELSYKSGKNSILLNSRYIPELKWYLLVEQSYETTADKLFRTLIINLVLCFFIALFIGRIIHVVVSKSHNELEKMALIDKLTNVYNRQAFEMMISKALEENKIKPSKLSLIIFDVDEFKEINDTYGHTVGDRVIKKISDIAVSLVRESDTVFRWGGDEFVILLKNCGVEKAFHLAEKIKKAVFNTEFHEKGVKFKTSLSCGVIQHSNNENADDMLRRADELLYKSKQKGKNRTEK